MKTKKELREEFDNLEYRYAHSGQPDHEKLWSWIEKALQAKEEEMVERVEDWFTLPSKHRTRANLLSIIKKGVEDEN